MSFSSTRAHIKGAFVGGDGGGGGGGSGGSARCRERGTMTIIKSKRK